MENLVRENIKTLKEVPQLRKVNCPSRTQTTRASKKQIIPTRVTRVTCKYDKLIMQVAKAYNIIASMILMPPSTANILIHLSV